ncbi:MAG: hypothetical protein R2867_40625 [Caldilineaceae bacterium]
MMVTAQVDLGARCRSLTDPAGLPVETVTVTPTTTAPTTPLPSPSPLSGGPPAMVTSRSIG